MDGAGDGVQLLQAVQRVGRVHTACVHTSIAVTGRYRGSAWEYQAG